MENNKTRRGLLDWLFPKEEEPQKINAYEQFKLLTAYEPVFHNHRGGIYESELVRSAIEAKARHISKLKVEMQGSAQTSLKEKLKHAPNEWMTWPQFLARCSTILDCTNNLFIVPVQDRYLETIGFFPVLPDRVKLVEDKKGNLWLRYTFRNNQSGIVEFDRCAYLNKHQYQSDFFGDSNRALDNTMDLISIQEQGISQEFRFISLHGQSVEFHKQRGHGFRTAKIFQREFKRRKWRRSVIVPEHLQRDQADTDICLHR